MSEQPEPANFTADWEAWHEAREAELGDPYGWLSVTEIVFPGATPETIAHVPGAWSADESGITVALEEGEWLDLEGERITGTYSFGPFVEREAHYLTREDLRLEVSKWGETYIIRPRIPRSAALEAYRGIPTFEPDESWSIVGEFRPFPWPRQFHLDAEGGLKETYESPGEVYFTKDGVEHSLTAFYGQFADGPGGLFLLFRDQTSGKETYGSSRSVRTAPVRADSTVVIDFNRAMNMPCAFSDNTVCVLPPAQNTLALRVLAGEKTPYERH